MKIRSAFAAVAACAMAITSMAPIADAQSTPGTDTGTYINSYPETPLTNAKLPIVHTQRKSDHIRASMVNKHPVCNSTEDVRTVIYRANEKFVPIGAISAKNTTDADIPLTQSLSQSITISESMTTSLTVSMGYEQDPITLGLALALGRTTSKSLTWSEGQQIGPYMISPGETGTATYGFRTLQLTGTQQYCLPNGTWSTPTPYIMLAPMDKHVVVETAADTAGNYDGYAEVQAQVNEQVANQEEFNKDYYAYVDARIKSAESEAALLDMGGNGEGIDPNEGAGQTHAYDLTPVLTTAKADGFSGAVALRVKNVGTKDYFNDFPAVQFRVDVKSAPDTPESLQGVDRWMTPGWFNGAYTRDLGYNTATGTRTFLVSLSNPIKAGETKLVANLHFGDGLIEGERQHNIIEVTQIGRAEGDTSFYNDQKMSSLDITTNDFGNKVAGRF
ncbi:MAG: hypothetical protein SPI77_02780 [Corynebacterium sp.]|nr:hypothetical protein [Corynebacterium sp.]